MTLVQSYVLWLSVGCNVGAFLFYCHAGRTYHTTMSLFHGLFMVLRHDLVVACSTLRMAPSREAEQTLVSCIRQVYIVAAVLSNLPKWYTITKWSKLDPRTAIDEIMEYAK